MNAKRRFHVLDALILIAFTAFGFAWCIAVEHRMRLLPAPTAQQMSTFVAYMAQIDLELLTARGDLRARLIAHEDPREEGIVDLQRRIKLLQQEKTTSLQVYHNVTSSAESGWRSKDPVYLAKVCFRCRSFFLVVWTVAFIVLRMKGPRPALRRLLCHWGTSGCATALLYLFCVLAAEASVRGGALVFSLGTGSLSKGVASYSGNVVKSFAAGPAPAIVAIWCLLALGRRLRCERSWLEWLGVVLCAGWIALWLYATIGHVLPLPA